MKLLTFSIILWTGLVLVRCSDNAKASPTTTENMTCLLVNGTNFDIQRCENSEAVCFVLEGGISCKWK